MIGFALGGVAMGRLVDRFGVFRPVVAGIVALALGYVLAAQAASLWQFALIHALLVSFFGGGVGGAPLLWQHLSYIFFTGAHMIIAITALGAISEIVQTFTRREIPGRSVIIGSMVVIAVVGTLAWTQNMITAPIPSGWKYYGMLLSISLIVPFGLIFWNLISAVGSADFNMRAPLRYAMAALSLASIGLIVEVSQSTIAIGSQLQQTYDAWAATHSTVS